MPATIDLAPSARRDLREIAFYLLDKVSSRTARKAIARITARIDALRAFPLTGRLRDDIGDGRRIAVCRPYLIVYVVETRESGRTVRVMRVVHGARDLESLMAQS